MAASDEFPLQAAELEFKRADEDFLKEQGPDGPFA
jgi:hypothetical protein